MESPADKWTLKIGYKKLCYERAGKQSSFYFNLAFFIRENGWGVLRNSNFKRNFTKWGG
jgi:hypothetical protein